MYFWNDKTEGRQTQESRAKTAARQLERMILRDANHPAVIFWSVSNETNEDDAPAVAESNRALIRRACELDPTRLCVHVSSHWTTHPNFAEDAVICVNHYPSLNWSQRERGKSLDLGHSVDVWSRELEKLHRQYPSKPILITEFGYCSFAGTFETAFGEDDHARVLEAEFGGFNKPFICGAAIWCWADHAWPAGRFAGGLTVSPYGVLSRSRRKLKPFWTARAMFRARQGFERTTSHWEPSGTSIIMLRPDMTNIPDFPFPQGYGIRLLTGDDIGLWTDIERDAEPFIQIRDTTFMDAFGDDLEAVRWRCHIITNPKGLGIGTISAWYDHDFRGQDYGRIHWVALRPSCQGIGLGKAALSYALKQLAQWHDRCYLVTQAERTVAVHLYLQFGFEPDFTPANACANWHELGTRLKHPVLQKALAQVESAAKGRQS